MATAVDKLDRESPGLCCPHTRCALTAPPEYQPCGGLENVMNHRNGCNLRYYKVKPEAPSKKAIVLIHDIFGLDVGRHFGVCDALSQISGATVIAPDLLRGDVATWEMVKSPALLELVARHPIDSLQKDLDHVYEDLLPKAEFDSIILVGFCWGAWVVFHEGGRLPDPRIKAGANYHPSLGLAEAFGNSVDALIKANRMPMMLCSCVDDPPTVKPGPACLLPTQIIHLFERQNHGFMTQGDVSKEEVKEDIDHGLQLFFYFSNLTF